MPEETLTEKELIALANRLDNQTPSVRFEAERTLQARPDAAPALLKLAQREARRQRFRAVGIISFFLCLVTAPILILMDWMGIKGLSGILGGVCGALIVSIAWRWSISRQQRNLLRALLLCDDMHAIGPLLDVSMPIGQSVQSVDYTTATILERLLPRLQAAEAELLTSRQQAQLRALLSYKSRPELIRAVLIAMRQTKDVKAIRQVRSLAAGKGAARRNPRLEQEAQQTLRVLEQNIERGEEANTLLRGASAGEASVSQELLRPVTGGADPNPQTLLRSSEKVNPPIGE